MPIQRKDRGDIWLARVQINGRIVDSKAFPAGKLNGPEWTDARNWEIRRKKEILAALEERRKTLTGWELFLEWGNTYLEYVKRSLSHSTYVEKRAVFQALFAFCKEEEIKDLQKLTRPVLYRFLSKVADERGPKRANVFRKNLLTAWNWGVECIEGFPQWASPLERLKPFPADVEDRYVPPEEDVIKVMQQAEGQDLVMLLAYYYTGARRSEIFRLTWSKDVNLETGMIRLTDHKANNGKKRIRWLQMHPELIKAMRWWYENRPCKVDNVFMQTHCDGALGKPFVHRNKLMPRLCEKAGVKPFGLHALRHKSAAITFASGGLAAAQQLMGHYHATTTDRYVRSAGLYADHGVILSALEKSVIGKAAEELLNEKMPQRLAPDEAFSNQNSVTK